MARRRLLVALDYLELLVVVKPEKLERAAVRWHGRLGWLMRGVRPTLVALGREPRRGGESAELMIYRYVLHLGSSKGRRTIRWTFTRPVSASETIEIPTIGRWYVSRVVTEDGSDSGVLYCTEPP